MVSSFFSRAKSTPEQPAETPAETPAIKPELEFDPQRFATVVKQWQAQLRQQTSINLQALPNRLSLTTAHPSGLAQLYAERNTRMTSLVRDPQQLPRAEEAVRRIFATSLETATSRGVSATHIAWGLGSWTQAGETVESPLLLRPVQFSFDPQSGESAMQLVGQVLLAPQVAQAVRQAGRELNEAQITGLTQVRQGFSPDPALRALQSALTQVLPDFTYTPFIEVAQFLHPAQALVAEYADASLLAHSPVVRGLAGDKAALEFLPEGVPEANPFDRDPDAETGFGDQLPEQLDVVEAISTGVNALLDTSGGANPTRTVASALVAAAVNGKTALFVSADRRRSVQLWDYLAAHGLSHVVARVDASAKAAPALLDSLRSAFETDVKWADLGQIREQRQQLREVRSQLENYTIDLHTPHEKWGVSAYDALQVLTDLMAARPGPRTRVRFTPETLTKLANDTDEVARNTLLEAAEAGIFQVSDSSDAWFGAVISAPEQVTKVLERINTLVNEKLPAMRVNMSATAGQTGLTPAATFLQWEEQLRMLDGIRDALDVFQPVIFERHVADMVIATASSQWRRDHGAEMKRAQRVRLTKQAKDMLRPGRYVEDLHAELKKVQKQRAIWREHCEAGGWPKVPANLDEMLQEVADIREILEKLNPALGTAHGNLTRLEVGELSLLLKRLSQDPEGAAQIPSRLQVLKKLNGFGLDEFVKDLRKRSVPASLIEAELELAWWASALGVMVTEVPSLGGFAANTLQDWVIDFRRLDELQTQSLEQLASDTIRRNRSEVLLKYYAEERQLRQALADEAVTEENVTQIFAQSQFVRDLFPIVISSPALVPHYYTLTERVDLLIIDSVADLPLTEVIPLLARAKQVVVTADCTTESETVQRLLEVLTVLQILPDPLRINGYVSQLFHTYQVRHTAQAVPVPRLGSRLSVDFVDGRGMPAPDAVCIESTSEEVAAVTDLILEHGLKQPERSLAVVASNRIHAQRIREHLKTVASTSPALSDFFRPDSREPFVILHPEVLSGQQRDRVIFTLGYAKTPHGRVLHNFGEISNKGGEALLASLLSVARDDLHIVSSVQPEEFDRSRFSAPGPLMLLDLLQLAMEASEADANEWPVVDAAPDQLLIDLAHRLYKLGLQVIPNIGGQGALRVPLAVGHPYIPGELLVALSTDDEVYVSEPSLRRRDRYWPTLLEANGWKTRTELSMAVFIDPQREADAVVELILDAVDERIAADPQLAELFANQATLSTDEDPAAEPDGLAAEEASEAELEPTPESPAEATGAGEAESLQAADLLAGTTSEAESAPSGETEEVWEAPVGKVRGPRPQIARGLGLAAYSDEQLLELAQWLMSDELERSETELADLLAEELELAKSGAQVEAVLLHIARRAL